MRKKKRLGVGGNSGRGPGAVYAALEEDCAPELPLSGGQHFMRSVRVFGEGSFQSAHISTPLSWHLWHLPVYLSIIRGSLCSPFWIHLFPCIYGICSNMDPVFVSIIQLFFSIDCFSCYFLHSYDVLKAETNNLGEKVLQ